MINIIFTASIKIHFQVYSSSEAPGLLTFKFTTKEQMVVIISNIASKLKTKQLQTIYNDIIIVPEMLSTDRVVFSKSIIEKFGIWGLFFW